MKAGWSWQWGGLQATTNTEEGAKPALRVGVEGEAETVYGPGAEAASVDGVGAEPVPAAKTGLGAATETDNDTETGPAAAVGAGAKIDFHFTC